jgi:hypothetical protein
MTGGIFEKDEPALRQAEKKPRLKWPAYVWFAMVGLSNLGRILSDPGTGDGEIIGAYICVALIVAIVIFRMRRRQRQIRTR